MKRSYNPIWFDNDERKDHCLTIAEIGEQLFRQVTGAVQGTREEDLQHIDCHWKGKKVDVKGLKPMHKQGYLLVEFLNIFGTAGWCSKDSRAEFIAFQFEDHFLIIEKNKLRDYTIARCPSFNLDEVWRQNHISPEAGLYKWCGRYRSKDVFTYILAEEGKKIADEIIYFVKS